MLSRDTVVHAAVILLALVFLAVFNALFPDAQSSTLTFVTLMLYGLVLAGAHLVLAWLGDDSLVPVESRWRFVGFVVVLLALIAVVLFVDPITIAGVRTDAVATVLGVGLVVVYWVLEASSGYESTRD